jgi:hypothetical protein
MEGEVNSFLGITINCNGIDGSFISTQMWLIKKLLKATDMQNYNAKLMPCSGDGKLLRSDKVGVPAKEDWSYASAMGRMMLYLASNS